MMRGVAILAVLLIHISADVLAFSQSVEEINPIFLMVNQLSRFAVPLFIFLSGLGLTLSNRKESYSSFLQRRLSKLLSLYILWSVLYYIALHLRGIDIVEFLILTITGGNYYHLYYVPVIIMFYVLFPVMKRLAGSNILVILFLISTIFVQLSNELYGITAFEQPINILNWSFYFILGIWFARRYSKLKNIITNYRKIALSLFVLISIGIVSESYWYLTLNFDISGATTAMRPGIIVYTIIFIILMISRSWKNNKVVSILNYLADSSYGIYLSHALFLSVWSILYGLLGLEINSVYYLISSLIVVLISSIIATKILDMLLKKIKEFRASKEVVNPQ